MAGDTKRYGLRPDLDPDIFAPEPPEPSELPKPSEPLVTVYVDPPRPSSRPQFPRIRLPRMRIPRLRLPRPRVPRLRLPRLITARRAAALAVGILLLLVVAPAGFVALHCASFDGAASTVSRSVPAAAAGVPGYLRSEASTYLALPEWYVVYTADAQAAWLREGAPSRFPHVRAIAQYWGAYRVACGKTKRAYPFDARAHLRLAVVGVSFTVEHAVKGLYEGTIGRAVEWAASDDTDADAFARRTAHAYAEHLHRGRWYGFPFGRTLAALWRGTGFWGPHPLRTWERKLVLTAEYGLKGAGALVARTGARVLGPPDEPRVHARVEGVTDAIFRDRNVRGVKALGRRSYVLSLPHGEAFTRATMRLVARRARFVDIAGNDAIVVSAVVPGAFRDAPVHGNLVFSAPLLDDAARRRVALEVPVRALHEILPALQRRGARIEHLYPY